MNYKCILLFFLTVFCSVAKAQNRRLFKVWYDADRRHIKETYYVIAGDSTILDGEYMTFYQNFNIKTQGQYKNNVATGPWVYYYENGNKKMEGDIENFLQTGLWRYYYENGSLSMTGPMKKGKKDGYWRFYYEDGKIKSEGTMKEGKYDGEWIYYYDDGVVKAKAYYNEGIGKYEEYYQDGTLKSQGKLKHGKSDSLWTYYHPNGKLKAMGYEDVGVKSGKWQFFYENGKLASEGMYKDGQTNGEWKYYEEDGTLKATGTEKNGYREGQWRMFYNNGKLKGDGIFSEGDGTYTEYYENGGIKIKGSFTKGKYDGKWTYYYENGVLEGECIYNNGEGWYTGYYPDGNKKMEGLLKDGNKIGVWKLYKNDGGIAGYYKTYYEDYDKKKPAPQSQPKTDTVGYYDKNEKPVKTSFFPKLRLYRPNPLVYKTFILSFDISGPLISQRIPLKLEYYVQEKWGVEFMLAFIRSPLFASHESLPLKSIRHEGTIYSFAYKRYQKNDEFIGRPYIGGEIQLKNLSHSTEGIDTLTAQNTKFAVQEKGTIELNLIIGDRFMRKFNKSGLTLDILFALGVGYKNPQDISFNNEFDQILADYKKNEFYPNFSFTLSVGYAF